MADNITQLRRIATLSVPNGLIADTFFSPDGGTMITWKLDGEVLVWARDTREKRSLQLVQVPVTQIQAEMRTRPLYYGAAALSPKGQLIITVDGSEAGRAVGRNLEGTVLFSSTYGAPVFTLAFSSGGRRLGVGNLRPSIALFDVPSRTHAVDLTSD